MNDQAASSTPLAYASNSSHPDSKIEDQQWSIDTSKIDQSVFDESIVEAPKTDGEKQNAWEVAAILRLEYGRDKSGKPRLEALIQWLPPHQPSPQEMSHLYGGPEAAYGCAQMLKAIMAALSEEDKRKVQKAADECEGEEPWMEKLVEWSQ